MPKVLRDYEVYLVYVDPDRCDSCEQCLIMCPTDVFEMPHKAIAAGRRAAVSIDQYLGGDGRIELGSGKVEGGMRNAASGP
jgi:NAD-dependent dihydropyrimidine dehydrogenase PreA subunit